jgi:uncharacterized membrane protein YfcA
LSDPVVWLGLALLGGGISAYSTVVGAGGGFLLTPFLILLFPDYAPEVITAMSLGVVLANAFSGSVAYVRQGRVDFVVALILAATAVPAAVAGAHATSYLDRNTFEPIFGAFLFCIAVWLILPHPTRVMTSPPSRRTLRRMVTDHNHISFAYSFSPSFGAGLGLIVGFLSALFGVGGGIMLTPSLIVFMRLPAYIATSTSTFAQLFSAAAAVSVHIAAGRYGDVLAHEISLIVGVLVGAQIGARISEVLVSRQALIVRLLSGALVIVSLRLLLGSLL